MEIMIVQHQRGAEVTLFESPCVSLFPYGINDAVDLYVNTSCAIKTTTAIVQHTLLHILQKAPIRENPSNPMRRLILPGRAASDLARWFHHITD